MSEYEDEYGNGIDYDVSGVCPECGASQCLKQYDNEHTGESWVECLECGEILYDESDDDC